jgi:hypothetical protein
MSSGSTLFKKGEDMDKKLVLLIEGTLTTSQGEKYCDTVPTIVNEEAFF